MLSFTGTVLDIVGVLIAVLAVLIAYLKWNHQYWRKKNVPYFKPKLPWGTFPNPLTRKETIGLSMKNIYNQVKQNNWKHCGLVSLVTPFYMPRDLEYIKNILTKDFEYFVDRGFYYNEKSDPLSAHLFSLGGTKWRNLRTKMTPTFTSGKMRMMFQTLLDCEEILQQTITRKCQIKEPIDIKELLACFTTDIIGSCAFGLELNTIKDDDSPFRRYGKKVFNPPVWQIVRMILASSCPNLAHSLGVRALDKDVTDFFLKIVKETVGYREKNNIVRKDFMQLLIDLKNNKLHENGNQHDGKSLTIEELAAECFIFFLAGFETSSTTMTFALYELATNQKIQDKVREEISHVLAKHDNKITYDALQEMKYMNQVIEETLRKYPPLPFVTRECVKDYKIPDEDVIIEKGTKVIIPIMGIHWDDNYYENPDKFDPERFNEENKNYRNPYTHMPFGEGPRVCIGLRFGLMQTKVGLTSLLRNYKLSLNPKTKTPLQMHIHSFILAVEGDVWLDFEKLKA